MVQDILRLFQVSGFSVIPQILHTRTSYIISATDRNKSPSIFSSQLDTLIAWVLACQNFDIDVSVMLLYVC
jgi:hypothetical protein